MTLDEAQGWAAHYEALGDACPFRIEAIVNAVGLLNERQPECGIGWERMWPHDDAWVLQAWYVPVNRRTFIFNPDEFALADALNVAIFGGTRRKLDVDSMIAAHQTGWRPTEVTL